MRGENLLFLPRKDGFRITDEFRERTYGTITIRPAPPRPPRPGRTAPRCLYALAIDLGGGMAMEAEFPDLAEAQDRAETYLRSNGALG